MIPEFKKQKELKIAFKPDGGLNSAEREDRIDDNQSSLMLNLWQRGGALTLRPGVVKAAEEQFGEIVCIYPRDGRKLLLKRIEKNGATVSEKYGVYVIAKAAVLTFDGTEFEKAAGMIAYENGGWQYHYNDYHFENCVLLPAGPYDYAEQDSDNMTWSAKGAMVYLFGSGYSLLIGPNVIRCPVSITEIHVTADILVNLRTPYVPTIAEDCGALSCGDKKEARNLMTPCVTEKFTTDDKNKTYRLFDRKIDNDELSAVYDNLQGTVLNFDFGMGQTTASDGQITATLDRENGTIAFSSPLCDAGAVKGKNNLAVTYGKTVSSDCPTARCSIGAWFSLGGEGDRMILSGDLEKPNRLYCSAPDDPSYFPENGVIDAGDPTEPVTALAEQYDILAVFKKNRIFALKKESGGIELSPVHAGCGCDMPGSIQLIDNRLVFGNTSGGIYTLVSTQIKNERAVRQISANVSPLLLKTDLDALEAAGSFDSGRYYMLFAGGKAFLWDYKNSPYKTTYDELKAGRLLNWYYWELPETVGLPFAFNGDFWFYGGKGVFYRMDEDSASDDGKFFDAYYYSKNFDFGERDEKKLVTKLNLQMTHGGEDTCPAYICLNQERGEERLEILLDGNCEKQDFEMVPPPEWSKTFSFGFRRMDGDLTKLGLIGAAIRAIKSV